MSSGMIWGYPADQVNALDAAYKASLDPRIVAAMAIDDYQQRGAALLALAQEGLLIDDNIMVGRADPFITQLDRLTYGLGSVPNALQAPVPPFDPGPYAIGEPLPPGALLVSINPADYKAFAPVVAPPPFDPKAIGPALGFQINGKEVFASAAQYHQADGYVTPDGAYTYHLLGTSLMSTSQRTGVWLKN